jgi:hypothetical protein
VVEQDRLDLIRSLRVVYNDAWDDEARRDRLIAEPRTVLAERGIRLPTTVEVEAELVEPEPPRGTLDDFFAEWDRMVDSGTVKLKVPASRPDGVRTRELSDADLDRVSGGGLFDAGGVDADGACA